MPMLKQRFVNAVVCLFLITIVSTTAQAQPIEPGFRADASTTSPQDRVSITTLPHDSSQNKGLTDQDQCTTIPQIANMSVRQASPTVITLSTNPAWMVGEWSTWNQTREYVLVLRAKGDFTERVFNYQTRETQTRNGIWWVDDDYFYLSISNQVYLPLITGGRSTAMSMADVHQSLLAQTTSQLSVATDLFVIEQVNDTAFRLVGGDLGIKSLLYSKVSSEAITTGRWFVSTWRSYLDTSEIAFWTFRADGTFQLRIESQTGSSEPREIEGNWSTDHTAITLFEDGTDARTTYRIEIPEDSEEGDFVNLVDQEGDAELLSRVRTPMVTGDDPASGYYIAGQVALELSSSGSDYDGVFSVRGEQYTFEARLNDGQLRFIIPAFSDSRPIVLESDFNSLRVIERPPVLAGTLPDRLRQLAEPPLTEPTGMNGIWMYESLVGEGTNIFLPDQRYFFFYNDSQYEDGVINQDSRTVTFDPSCSSPYDRTYQLIDNQLVYTFDNDVTSVYHFVPGSELMVASIEQQLNAQLATENAIWSKRLLTGPHDPNFSVPGVINPIPGGAFAIDPTPNDVFPDATVFTELQSYIWLEAPFGCVDYGTLGVRCNSLQFMFFPNGRSVLFAEIYTSFSEWGFSIVPDGTFIWLPYRIENERIIVGENNYELLNGNRRIVAGELCIDSVKWINREE